ncbi:acyltransferase [Niabella sp.]|uniref:acyltransferase family protein n=1 Tax=Niabella sp. TaxID=1962976 RepID=UPI002612466C|nr:acyltransferase [Niabella sp.]
MKHLKFLDGIRGIFCVWVVLFHFTYRYTELFNNHFIFSFQNGGKVGVFVFFMLSGFLTLLTANKYYEKGTFAWLKAKLLRLYPAYFIACVVIYGVLFYFPLKGVQPTFERFIKDLCMLPFLSGNVEGAHWYVFSLVTFYTAFSIIAKYKLQDKVWFYACVLGMTVLSSFLNRIHGADLYAEVLSFVTFYFFNIQLYSGLLLLKAIQLPGRFLWLFIVAIAFLSLKVSFVYVPLIAAFLYVAIRYSDRLSGVKKILEHPVLLFIAGVSYMWYLVHQNIGYMLMNQQLRYGFYPEIVPYISMLLTFLLAALLHFFVEKPMTEKLFFKKR